MKNRKKNIKLILLLLIICITLGYAALRTGLNINGTANVSSSSWNVYFSNYQMSNATNITPTEEPEIVGTTTTSISYEVDLETPGDIYEFSVEVVNGGSMDANISLVSKYNGSEISQSNPVPEYITYAVTDENDDPIVDNHRLNHGERETVKVFVKYKDNDASVLPAQDVTGLSFDIEIEATKAEKEPVDSGVYVVSDQTMSIGSAIPQGVNIRNTPTEAMADWYTLSSEYVDTLPYFLKHKMNGNVIEESYIGFMLNGDYYYIQGGTGGENYIKNAKIIFDAFGSDPSNCDNQNPYDSGFNQPSFYCNNSSFSVTIQEDDYAWASDPGYECDITNDGESYCIVRP